MNPAEKRTYEAPSIVTLGTLAEFTAAARNNPTSDKVLYASGHLGTVSG